MAAQTAREGWIALGDAHLQRRHVYHKLAWPCAAASASANDFAPALLLAVSPSGAFLASARNEAHPLLVVSDFAAPDPPLSLYSAAGDLLLSIPWDREPASIIALGWTSYEHLVAVLDDASVRVYSPRGECIAFELGANTRTQRIHSCRISPSALAVCTRDGRYIVVADWAAPFPKLYQQPPILPNAAHVWSLVESAGSTMGAPELIVSDEKAVYIVSESSVETCAYAGIKRIVVSPYANFWACVVAPGTLQIRLAHSAQFEASCDLATFFEPDQIQSLQFCWCSEDAVVVCSPEKLLLLHVSGQQYVTDLYSRLVLSPTDGGCFLLSAHDLSLISPVHYSMRSIFQVASRHPGAMLLHGYNHTCYKSPQAAELLEPLLQGSQLAMAVKTCIDAAVASWDVVLQKTLLRAAQLGRVWVRPDTEIRDQIATACRTLRVLNAIRHRDIGLPLTSAGFTRLGGLSGVLRLLVSAGKHKQAYEMAASLGLSKTHVVGDWARMHLVPAHGVLPFTSASAVTAVSGSVPSKIKSKINVEVLAKAIRERLAGDPGVDYVVLARTAAASGQVELAVMLLEYEVRAVRQVPVLLELQMYEEALQRAVASLQTDLVMLSLVFLRKKLKLADFCAVAKATRGAHVYLDLYARQHEPKLLRDLYFLEDRHDAMGQLAIEDFLQLSACCDPFGDPPASSSFAEISSHYDDDDDDIKNINKDNKDDSDGYGGSSLAALATQRRRGRRQTATEKLALLRDAVACFQSSRAGTSSSSMQVLAKMAEQVFVEQSRLAAADAPTVDAGVVPGEAVQRTLERLLRMRHYGTAVKVAKQFGCPAKMLTWCVLRVCVHQGTWGLLDQHVQSFVPGAAGRRDDGRDGTRAVSAGAVGTALGVAPECIVAEIMRLPMRKDVALKFISMCDAKERGGLCLRAGGIREAARAYFQVADLPGLQLVRRAATDRIDIEIADGFIAQVTSGGGGS